jgi:hypothetical protein
MWTKNKSNIAALREDVQKLQAELPQIKAQAADIDELKKTTRGIEIQMAALGGTVDGYKNSAEDFLKHTEKEIAKQAVIASQKAVETEIAKELASAATSYLMKVAREEADLARLDNVPPDKPETAAADTEIKKSMRQVICDVEKILLERICQIKPELPGSLSGFAIKPLDRAKEFLHESFDKMISCIEAGVIPMLVGPAGTGKSTAVEQAARHFGQHFYTANRVQNSFELTGYNDANGRYVPTQFYNAYKNGGIFFFDEIDASSPDALITINTAVAQGYMAFPGETIPVVMHPNFKVVAAGNTYGSGANRQYCGRNNLDAATLDRFMVIEWGYDKKLEQKIIKDDALLRFAWAVREVLEQNRMSVIISTRGILATKKILDTSTRTKSFTIGEALVGNLFEGLNIDAINKIIGGLNSLDQKRITTERGYVPLHTNPYYIATKALVK